MKNSRHVGGGGGSSWYAPMVRSRPLPLLYQLRVWATSGGVSSRGRLVRETNARASLTNAAVSRLPAPIKKPRLESIKKPPEFTHASGGLATYCCPFRATSSCHRCRSRLVGGAEALSGCNSMSSRLISGKQGAGTMLVALRRGLTARDQAAGRVDPCSWHTHRNAVAAARPSATGGWR